MLAEGVKLCLVLCFNLYLHHLPETPIEPRFKAVLNHLQILVFVEAHPEEVSFHKPFKIAIV
jgi:hypothetical protein